MGWQAKIGSKIRNRPKHIAKSLTLFGSHVFDSSTLILVESPLDCVRLRAAGIEGAVSSFGAAVSDEQVALMLSLADDIILAEDNDDAGEKALWGDKKHPGLVSKLEGRVRLRLLNYKGIEAKDPGDMTDAECQQAVELSQHSFMVV